MTANDLAFVTKSLFLICTFQKLVTLYVEEVDLSLDRDGVVYSALIVPSIGRSDVADLQAPQPVRTYRHRFNCFLAPPRKDIFFTQRRAPGLGVGGGRERNHVLFFVNFFFFQFC